MNAQRRAAQGLEPATLQPPALAGGRGTAVVRIRFYADEDYRAGLFRWAERARAQLSHINEFVEPGFGIRFEPESFRRWHRSSKTSDVQKLLAELEQHDAGEGVDWVVAFVTPLPLVTSSIHEIGAARVLGKHFVLRGMASAEEAQALGQGFNLLEPAEREALYARRKWHKETVIFLHEWLHTLGAMHASDPQRIMNPSYSNRMRNLSSEDAQLVLLALRARLAARGGERIDYSDLRGFLERTTSPEWAPRERQELIDALVRGGARLGAPPAVAGGPTGALPAEDRERFDRAVELLKAGKGGEAWPLVQPLATKHAGRLDVQRLLCRLSYHPAAHEEGAAACERAQSLAPDDPDPLVDDAQARIQRGEHAAALALTDRAAERARKLSREQSEIWIWIARLYGQLGALARAEEAVGRAEGVAPPEAVRGVREAIARDRVTLGLPASDGGFRVAPEREPAYAARHRRASELLAAGKAREARAAADEALAEFPGAPGLEVIACEAELRQRRARQAERLCLHALSVMDELPRAHYLVGHIRLRGGNREAAITAFRRALELDPREPGTWETLADVYRMAGKRAELAQLKAEYEKAFAKPLR